MNLAIALHDDPLPEDEQPAPEKQRDSRPRWGNALKGPKPKSHKGNDFGFLYEHEKPFVPEWAGKAPGSCPQLPLKPPGKP